MALSIVDSGTDSGAKTTLTVVVTPTAAGQIITVVTVGSATLTTPTLSGHTYTEVDEIDHTYDASIGYFTANDTSDKTVQAVWSSSSSTNVLHVICWDGAGTPVSIFSTTALSGGTANTNATTANDDSAILWALADPSGFSSSLTARTNNIIGAGPGGAQTLTAGYRLTTGTAGAYDIGCDGAHASSFFRMAASEVPEAPVTGPTANADSAQVNINSVDTKIDVLANDTAGSFPILGSTLVISTAASGGTATVVNDAGTYKIEYDAPATPGVYTVGYKVSDNQTPANQSAEAILTITVVDPSAVQTVAVQRGNVTTSGTSTTGTITAVDTAKSFVRIVANNSSFGLDGGTTNRNFDQFTGKVALTNSTTVTVSRITGGSTVNFRVPFEVWTVDGTAVALRHVGSITMANGVTTADSAALSGITDINDCVPVLCYQQSDSGTRTNGHAIHATIEMVSASGTKVRATRGNSTGALEVGIAVLEFLHADWTVHKVSGAPGSGSAAALSLSAAVTWADCWYTHSYRAGAGALQEQAVKITELADSGGVSRLGAEINGGTAGTVVVYVVEDTGGNLDSSRTFSSTDSATNGESLSITAVADVAKATVWCSATISGTGTAYPRSLYGAHLNSTTGVLKYLARTSNTLSFNGRVTVWPTKSVATTYDLDISAAGSAGAGVTAGGIIEGATLAGCTSGVSTNAAMSIPVAISASAAGAAAAVAVVTVAGGISAGGGGGVSVDGSAAIAAAVSASGSASTSVDVAALVAANIAAEALAGSAVDGTATIDTAIAAGASLLPVLAASIDMPAAMSVAGSAGTASSLETVIAGTILTAAAAGANVDAVTTIAGGIASSGTAGESIAGTLLGVGDQITIAASAGSGMSTVVNVEAGAVLSSSAAITAQAMAVIADVLAAGGAAGSLTDGAVTMAGDIGAAGSAGASVAGAMTLEQAVTIAALGSSSVDAMTAIAGGMSAGGASAVALASAVSGAVDVAIAAGAAAGSAFGSRIDFGASITVGAQASCLSSVYLDLSAIVAQSSAAGLASSAALVMTGEVTVPASAGVAAAAGMSHATTTTFTAVADLAAASSLDANSLFEIAAQTVIQMAGSTNQGPLVATIDLAGSKITEIAMAGNRVSDRHLAGSRITSIGLAGKIRIITQ